MELLQLKYFCNAAETENFSKTAKKFLVPTSNISQSIKRLEKELDCKLFDHRSNRIVLNSEGKLFYDKISQALELLDEGKAALSEKKNEIYGDIRLICLSNRRIITKAIEEFIKIYPNVNFTIHHNLNEGIDFDIIISDECPCEYSKKTLLVDEDFCVAMNKDSPLVNKAHLLITDLLDTRLITMTSGSSLQKITVKACNAAGFTPNIAIQTDDPYYVRKYVEIGLGVALVPTKSWEGLFPDRVVLKKLSNLRRQTYAFIPKRSYNKRVAEIFLNFLSDNKANN